MSPVTKNAFGELEKFGVEGVVFLPLLLWKGNTEGSNTHSLPTVTITEGNTSHLCA